MLLWLVVGGVAWLWTGGGPHLLQWSVESPTPTAPGSWHTPSHSSLSSPGQTGRHRVLAHSSQLPGPAVPAPPSLSSRTLLPVTVAGCWRPRLCSRRGGCASAMSSPLATARPHPLSVRGEGVPKERRVVVWGVAKLAWGLTSLCRSSLEASCSHSATAGTLPTSTLPWSLGCATSWQPFCRGEPRLVSTTTLRSSLTGLSVKCWCA